MRGQAGGRGRGPGGRAVVRVAVEGLIAVVAAEGNLTRGWWEEGFLLPRGWGGKLGGLHVKVYAREEEAGGVEKGAIGLTPVIDEWVGKVPGRGV